MHPNSQNTNEDYNNKFTSAGYGKKKIRNLPLIIIALFVGVALTFVIYLSLSQSDQEKYTKEATVAARKVTPNAEVRKVKVADGFAIATVSDPTANGQAKAGNTAIFKVNTDGSMTQLADGSDFSPVDLLKFGIPLATQAELTDRNLSQVQHELASLCNYSGGNTPGYVGFNSSFNPDGWQIDAASLDGITQALSANIINTNTKAQNGEKVVCVNAVREKSNVTTDLKTYASTFTLKLEFITNTGTVTNHTFTFTLGPKNSRSYTLDGQKLQTR